MKFSEEFIDRVREASDLVQVISQHVDLKRSGSGYQGLCPFHGEKTPSFSVSDTKQVYHCFGCKASGNVFKFVEQYQGLTFPEAVEYLAGRAGIPLPEPEQGIGPSDGLREEKALMFRLNAFAAEFYHQRLNKLPRTHEVWAYLLGRGFSESDVNKYKMGWASTNWSDLSEALARKSAPIDLAEKIGLVKKRNQKSGHFDLFRGRVMFPIYSPTEKCLGFGGRVLGDEHPKYLNSPDSPIFHKGQVFYGLNMSAKYLRSKDRAIVVEGYMDWIALDRVGIGEVVATLGTALTERHAKALKRYTENVTVLFDGDSAGRSAARRSLPILLSEGLYVKGVFLPNKQDPDDYIREHGVDSLNALIDRAPDLFNLIVEEDLKEAGGTPSDKTKMIEEMRPILAAVENLSLRALYVESLASYLNVDKSVINVSSRPQTKGPITPKRVVEKVAQKTAPEAMLMPSAEDEASLANTRPQSVIKVESYSRVEQTLLNVCLLRSVYLDEVLKAEVIDHIRPESLKQVFVELARLYRQDPSKFDTLPSLLSSRVEPGELLSLHLTPPFQMLTDDSGRKLIQDCIKRLRGKFQRSREKELINNLGRSHGQEQQKNLEQIMNSQRDRKHIKTDVNQE